MNPMNPTVGVGVSPQVVHTNVPPKAAPRSTVSPSNYEGMTVHEAIKAKSGEVGLDKVSIKSLVGKFPQDGNQAIVGAVHESDNGKKYFKFDVQWTAKVADKNPPHNEQEVTFSQTIYTNVEVPTGGSAREFEGAKQQAYDVAKSFETIQHNLVKPEKPPDGYKDAYKTELRALKENNVLFFKRLDENSHTAPLSGLMEGHHATNFEARTPQGIKLSFFATRTSEVGRDAIFSNAHEYRDITVQNGMNTNIPAAKFEQMERKGVTSATIPSDEGRDYTAHLKEKEGMYQDALIGLKRAGDGELRAGQEAQKSENVQALKTQYLELKKQIDMDRHVQGPQTAAEAKAAADRSKQLKQLKEDIFIKAGIPKMEARLEQMEQLKGKYKNINDCLGANQADPEFETQFSKIGRDIEAFASGIGKLKDKLLEPTPEAAPAEAAAPIPEAIDLTLEEVRPQENIPRAKSLMTKVSDYFTSWIKQVATPLPNPLMEEPIAARNEGMSEFDDQEKLAFEASIKEDLKKLLAANGKPTDEVAGLSFIQAENRLKGALVEDMIRKGVPAADREHILTTYTLTAIQYAAKSVQDKNDGNTLINLRTFFEQKENELRVEMKASVENGNLKPANFDEMSFNELATWDRQNSRIIL